MIQDGSSFALKSALAGTFPGRFTTIEPAAVEVHATYSGFADEVSRVQIAPDATAKRPSLPDPATLTGQLLLADRGYPSVAYFEAVAAHGGACIVRLMRSYDPWIRTAWVEGQRTPVPTRIRLSRFLAQHAGQRVDLDVDFHVGAPRRRVPRRGPAGPRGGDDAAVHQFAAHAVFARPGRSTLCGSAGRSNAVSRSGSRTRTCSSSTPRTRTLPKA